MNLMYWGYVHVNGTIHIKRYFGSADILEATESPFCKIILGPFQAKSVEGASLIFNMLLASIQEHDGVIKPKRVTLQQPTELEKLFFNVMVDDNRRELREVFLKGLLLRAMTKMNAIQREKFKSSHPEEYAIVEEYLADTENFTAALKAKIEQHDRLQI